LRNGMNELKADARVIQRREKPAVGFEPTTA
jgi:hypothetical protein